MEAFELRSVMNLLQNIFIQKLREAEKTCYTTYIDANLINQFYQFYIATHNMEPIFFCIDPFTFGDIFTPDDPDITQYSDDYQYKRAIIIFTRTHFGFFNNRPK